MCQQAQSQDPSGAGDRQAQLEAANAKLQTQLQRATQQLQDTQQLAQEALQARDAALQVCLSHFDNFESTFLGCSAMGIVENQKSHRISPYWDQIQLQRAMQQLQDTQQLAQEALQARDGALQVRLSNVDSFVSRVFCFQVFFPSGFFLDFFLIHGHDRSNKSLTVFSPIGTKCSCRTPSSWPRRPCRLEMGPCRRAFCRRILSCTSQEVL